LLAHLRRERKARLAGAGGGVSAGRKSNAQAWPSPAIWRDEIGPLCPKAGR
jgi:hypothetical protein